MDKGEKKPSLAQVINKAQSKFRGRQIKEGKLVQKQRV